MKNIYLIILVLTVMTMSLTACSHPADEHVMTIKPSEFSKETQEIMNIFNDEVMFWDCKLNETVKSYAIELWCYADGQWVEGGGVSGKIEWSEIRIAIRFTGDGYELSVIDENGRTKYSSSEIGTDFAVSTGTVSTQLINPTPIALNTEIPLWVKMGTDKNSMASGMDFRNADCNAGAAVTITFYDK